VPCTQTYHVPHAAPLTERETRAVSYYLQVRDAVHSGPLYTESSSARDSSTIATAAGGLPSTRRAYGREQINQRYGVRNKSTVDPFSAVPTWSSRQDPPPRTLADFSKLHFDHRFFPPELHGTIEGEDADAGQRKRGARLSSAAASLAAKRARLARQRLDLHDEDDEGLNNGFDPQSHHPGDQQRALAQMEALEKAVENGEDVEGLDLANDPEEGEFEGEDEVYSDDSGGDYNAEAAFENGEDYAEDDYGDDGGDEPYVD